MSESHESAQAGAASEMTNRLVLIADGNTARGRRLAEACERAGVSCMTGPHGAAALELALSERPGLVVAPVDLPLVDAQKLAEILRANPRTRRSRFLFLGHASSDSAAPGDLELPESAGTEAIVRAIEDLIGRQDRLDAVDQAAAAGQPVAGDLALVGLADLLALFQANRASGRLELTHGGEEVLPPGLVLIREGDVLQAECGTANGEKALFRLLAWREGGFAFEPEPVDEPAFIATSTRMLLQEGLRQLEEWDRLSTKLPPLDALVRLKLGSGELPNIVHPLTQEVLMLLELYGTVREVVDHCSFPDYQVLRTLATLADREIVELGRVPVPVVLPQGGEEPGLLNEAQVRRLAEWINGGKPPTDELPPARLLVATSARGSIPDFARLIEGLPGGEVVGRLKESGSEPAELETFARLDLGEGVWLDFVHLPRSERLAPLWAFAGHRALGTLFLLQGRVAEASERVAPMVETLRDLPRARTFHVAMLRKGERITPEELRENLTLIDEASLFLLPIESPKPPAALLRGLFARIVP